MSRASQASAAPRLRNGVMRRGSTWSFVIRVTDSGGVSKPRWVGGFPTEAAAKRARDEARIAAGRGEFVDRSTLTVQAHLEQWLLTHALEVRPRTRAGYAHLITTYVAPRIGRLRLQALRPADLSTLTASSWTRVGAAAHRCRRGRWSTSTRCCARRSRTRSATTRS